MKILFFVAFMVACIISIVAAMISYENWLFTGFFNLSNVYKVLIGVPGFIALAWLANFLWAIDTKWKSTLLVLTGVAALIAAFTVGVPLIFIMAMYFSNT